MSTSEPPAATSASWDYDELRRCLTNERRSSYFADSDGTVEGAFGLYEWNMRASAAVLELTSMVEVIVRNAIDVALSEWVDARSPGSSWLDIAPLDRHGRDDVARARERATRRDKDAEVHGKVIAELTLGFWRFLIESRYLTSLWVPATHRAFDDGHVDLRRRQREVAGRLKQLTFVRNRAAHHEPIHRRGLEHDLRAAIDLTHRASADGGAWVASKNSLQRHIAEHLGRVTTPHDRDGGRAPRG